MAVRAEPSARLLALGVRPDPGPAPAAARGEVGPEPVRGGVARAADVPLRQAAEARVALGPPARPGAVAVAAVPPVVAAAAAVPPVAAVGAAVPAPPRHRRPRRKLHGPPAARPLQRHLRLRQLRGRCDNRGDVRNEIAHKSAQRLSAKQKSGANNKHTAIRPQARLPVADPLEVVR